MNPIELSLFSSRINAICDEMGAVLRRTAFSPNIKDRLDFSCAIFDPKGRLCAQAAHIPVHLGSMTFAMRDIVKAITWEDGDMIVMNDPFQGGTHLPDVTVIAPVFIDHSLVSFVANRAHHADIGCESPGSMPLSQQLTDEGLIIPPMHLMRRGEILDDVLRKLLAQLIDPSIARGDFLAQISSNRSGQTRLKKMLENSQEMNLSAAYHALNLYADRAAKKLIEQLPDGSFTFTDYLEDDGAGAANLPITTTVQIGKGTMNFDFSGSADQTKGNVNCPLSVTAAAVYYVFYCLLPDHIPACDGCFRSVSISAPKGSLLNAEYPAAVAAGNVETSTRIVDSLLGALHQAIPERIPAASHGSMNNIAMGSDAWAYYETIGGGMGGHNQGNGLSAVQTHMTNSLNTPIEILEMNYPLRIAEYTIRKNSGGKGEHAGGDGITRTYEYLTQTCVTLLTERRVIPAWGINSTTSAQLGENLINGKNLLGKCQVQVKKGDVLCINTPGGGGWSSNKVSLKDNTN